MRAALVLLLVGLAGAAPPGKTPVPLRDLRERFTRGRLYRNRTAAAPGLFLKGERHRGLCCPAPARFGFDIDGHFARLTVGVGVDTNVLVRVLVDEPSQPGHIAAARALVSEAREVFVPLVVLVETVWVLEAAYGLPKPEILTALDHIMRTAQFEIPEKETAWLALNDYSREKGDFSDYYIGRANEEAGAEVTLTFDKSLKGSRQFKIIKG